jgi:hypothetical protein
MARFLVGSAVLTALSALAQPAFSQAQPAGSASFAESAPSSGAPAATQPNAPQPAMPAPPANQAAANTPPNGPYPTTTTAPPNGPYPTTTTAPPNGGRQPEDSYFAGQSGVVEPAAPPPKQDKGFEIPDMSVRVDPLNWLIYGKLGVELEAALWKFISVELVPVFVTNNQPPAMNYGSFPGNIHQASNGLGAMSGASVGAGFWLNGKPFEGTVLRFYYTNYGYRYTSKSDAGVVQDELTHTERHLVGYIGSHSRWGFFTIASGLGIGVELNRQRRCMHETNLTMVTDCAKDELDLKVPGSDLRQVTNMYDWPHPVYISFRLSLGVIF